MTRRERYWVLRFLHKDAETIVGLLSSKRAALGWPGNQGFNIMGQGGMLPELLGNKHPCNISKLPR
jgi:hypothetical protein